MISSQFLTANIYFFKQLKVIDMPQRGDPHGLVWVKYDENADGVHDEIWKYSYNNGLLTNYGYDENADGDLDWREQYEYNSVDLLLRTLEDDGGDGTWNNNWQYTYIDNYLDTVTYDIAQDNDIEETWTTEWNCP